MVLQQPQYQGRIDGEPAPENAFHLVGGSSTGASWYDLSQPSADGYEPHPFAAPVVEDGVGTPGLSHRQGVEAVRSWRLGAAQKWFQRGLTEFRAIGDTSNAALLLCNLASAKKLEAGLLPLHGAPTSSEAPGRLSSGSNVGGRKVAERTPMKATGQEREAPATAGTPNSTTNWADPMGPVQSEEHLPERSEDTVDRVERLLQAAIDDCYLAMELLGQRGEDPCTWDHIAEELAMAYLTLGVKRRQVLFTSSTSPESSSKARRRGEGKARDLTKDLTEMVTPGSAQRVAEPLDKAADVYRQLGDAKQLASTRYQAALLWSRLWMRAADPRRARDQLAKALGHYQAAHSYFAQAGGRTLAMINLDLCDLYMAVHAASPGGNLACLDKAVLCLLETHRAFGGLEGTGRDPATLGLLSQSELQWDRQQSDVGLPPGQAATADAESQRLARVVRDRLPKVLLSAMKAAAGAASPPTRAGGAGGASRQPSNAAGSGSPAKDRLQMYKSLYREALAANSDAPEEGSKLVESTKEVLRQILELYRASSSSSS